ncbi:MAG: hypothetical protein KJ939_08030 [Nanoarchaeota archaeon]|nr:hypothetical protein [Nanoarchaeota archaeon]
MTLEMKCLTHWQRLGIKDLKTLKEHIKAIFDKYQHQEEVLIALYKMVFPEWDQIDKVEGFPAAGNDLWQFICRCFQEFDRRNHPEVMPAGAWMNSGFSVNYELSPWEIGFKKCSVVYKDEIEVIAA